MARGEGARWLRPGNVFRAALVLWLVFVVVRAGRVAVTAGRAGDLFGFACGSLFLVGLLVFACFLAGVFFMLLAGIWQTRVDDRTLFPGFKDDGVMGAVIGLIMEGALYWFLFLSALGVVELAWILGVLAWGGDLPAIMTKGS
jgi:hypothetical protein